MNFKKKKGFSNVFGPIINIHTDVDEDKAQVVSSLANFVKGFFFA